MCVRAWVAVVTFHLIFYLISLLRACSMVAGNEQIVPSGSARSPFSFKIELGIFLLECTTRYFLNEESSRTTITDWKRSDGVVLYNSVASRRETTNWFSFCRWPHHVLTFFFDDERNPKLVLFTSLIHCGVWRALGFHVFGSVAA